MKPIIFEQYFMPDGCMKYQKIDRPDNVAEWAQEFINGGGRFEIELLGDYKTVSMTAERGEDEVIAHEICDNGPAVPIHVDILIARASGHLGELYPHKAK